MKNKLITERIPGKSYHLFQESISKALNGEIVMWSTPKGNVVILAYDKIKNIKLK